MCHCYFMKDKIQAYPLQQDEWRDWHSLSSNVSGETFLPLTYTSNTNLTSDWLYIGSWNVASEKMIFREENIREELKLMED